MAGDDPASALYAGVDEAVKERYFAVRRVKRAIRPIFMAGEHGSWLSVVKANPVHSYGVAIFPAACSTTGPRRPDSSNGEAG